MNHVLDGMLEPNPRKVHGEPFPKIEGLSECCLTNTDSVWDPRQAPEHSKSPSVYKILLESFMIDALGYRSCLEILYAWNYLV